MIQTSSLLPPQKTISSIIGGSIFGPSVGGQKVHTHIRCSLHNPDVGLRNAALSHSRSYKTRAIWNAKDIAFIAIRPCYRSSPLLTVREMAYGIQMSVLPLLSTTIYDESMNYRPKQNSPLRISFSIFTISAFRRTSLLLLFFTVCSYSTFCSYKQDENISGI